MVLLRVMFVALLCLGVWYGWNVYRGKKPKLPEWASLTGPKTNGTSASKTNTVTLPQRPTVTTPVNPATNIVARATNQPPPEVEHIPRERSEERRVGKATRDCGRGSVG